MTYGGDGATHVYSTKDPQDRIRARIQDIRQLESQETDLYDLWSGIGGLFVYIKQLGEEKRKVKDLVEEATEGSIHKIILIDLSNMSASGVFWNDDIKMAVIDHLLTKLKEPAQEQYKMGKFLNTLVVIDEPHRLAPRENPENEFRLKVKNNLVEAIRATRKFGLG
jgi:DNA helicase HerA-like ATPase